jgi:hypothetical protein
MAHTQFQWKTGVKPFNMNEFSLHIKKSGIEYTEVTQLFKLFLGGMETFKTQCSIATVQKYIAKVRRTNFCAMNCTYFV